MFFFSYALLIASESDYLIVTAKANISERTQQKADNLWQKEITNYIRSKSQIADYELNNYILKQAVEMASKYRIRSVSNLNDSWEIEYKIRKTALDSISYEMSKTSHEKAQQLFDSAVKLETSAPLNSLELYLQALDQRLNVMLPPFYSKEENQNIFNKIKSALMKISVTTPDKKRVPEAKNTDIKLVFNLAQNYLSGIPVGIYKNNYDSLVISALTNAQGQVQTNVSLPDDENKFLYRFDLLEGMLSRGMVLDNKELLENILSANTSLFTGALYKNSGSFTIFRLGNKRVFITSTDVDKNDTAKITSKFKAKGYQFVNTQDNADLFLEIKLLKEDESKSAYEGYFIAASMVLTLQSQQGIIVQQTKSISYTAFSGKSFADALARIKPKIINDLIKKL